MIGRKVLKWVGIIVGIAALLVGIFFAVVYLIIKPEIEDNIRTSIKNNLGQDYNFEYADYSLNVFNRSIHFDEVYITKSSIGKERVKQGATDIPHLSVYTKDIQISDIHLLKALVKKDLEIDLIRINEPMILHVAGEDFPGKGGSKNLETVMVNKIKVVDGNYKRFNRPNGENKEQVLVPRFNIDVDTLTANLMDTAKARPFNTHNFSYEAFEPEVKSPNFLLNITAAEARGNKLDRSASVNDFNILPNVGKDEISEIKGYQTTWIRSENSDINISGLDHEKLIFDAVLLADLVDINGFKITSYQNKNYPEPPANKKMPQQIIKDIGFDIAVREVKVSGGSAAYTEVPEKGNEPGNISFSNISATISNFTNLGERISNEPELRLIASTDVLGSLRIETESVFDLSGNDHSFTSKGTSSSISMPKFNTMAVPVGYIKIEEGQLEQASYTMQGNRKSAKGELKFLYNNLEMQLLNKETLDAGFVKELISTVGDIFVVKDSNPSDGETRIATMNYQRKENRSFFNYWWKTLLTGIRESIGAGFKNEEKTSTEEKDATAEETTEEEEGETNGAEEGEENIDPEEENGNSESETTNSEGTGGEEEEEEKGFFRKIFEAIKELIKKIINKIF